MASPQDNNMNDLLKEELARIAENKEMTMVVVGLAGEGKSTLVNSLLLMDPDSEEAAETDDEGLPVSHKVRCYTKARDGAKVKIWDTPGLQDGKTMDQEKVIKQLRKEAGEDVDLFLFCVKYSPGVRISSVCYTNIVHLLTKHFGKEFWRKVILVLTMVNTVVPQKRGKIPKLVENIENGLKNALRGAGVPEGIVKSKSLILAGLGDEPLVINEKIDWNRKLFIHCINEMPENGSRATLIQSREGKGVWGNFVDICSRDEGTITMASGAAGTVGLCAGGLVGAKVATMIGSMSIAVASSAGTVGATGAIAGTAAGTVAAVGTAAGTVAAAAGTTGAIAGTLGAGAAAGAIGTSAVAGAGGTMAAATGSAALAGTLSAGAVATACTGVGALALGVLATIYVAKYLKSRKTKEIE